MALRNLLVRVGADVSGMQKGMKRAQNSLNRFSSNVNQRMNVSGASIAAVGAMVAGAFVMAPAVKEAMNFEAHLQQVNSLMGESANEFAKWSETTGKAMGYSRQEAVKYGATFGNLFTMFTTSAEENYQATTKFMKTQAIIASKTGRTMEDVGERLRSGMLGNTEAIEDLGVNVQVSAIEMTKAFKMMANGKSWEQLNEQQKQTIRYNAILEQSFKKYGDTMADNTATRMMVFTASLNNVKLALGQAFLPILNIALPALTRLADKLATVLGYVSQFMRVLFPKGDIKAGTRLYDYQANAIGAVGDAALDTAKKQEKAAKTAGLAGFDQVHTLSENKGDSADGGSGSPTGAQTGDIGANPVDFTTNAPVISQKIKQMATDVKATMKNLSDFIKKHSDIIVSSLSGILVGFGAFAVLKNWSKITGAVTVAFEGLATAIGAISWPIVAVAALIGLMIANLVQLWRTNDNFRKSVIDTWNLISSTLTRVATELWTTLKSAWETGGKNVISVMGEVMKSIQNYLFTFWNVYLKPIIETITKTFASLWDEHLNSALKEVIEFGSTVIGLAGSILSGFIFPLIDAFVNRFGPVIAAAFQGLVKLLGWVLGVVVDVAKGLFKTLNGITDFISGAFSGNLTKAVSGLKDIFVGIFTMMTALIKVQLNWVIDMVNKMIKSLNKVQFNVPKWVPGDMGGKSFGVNIPNIPKLAKGGITNGPTLALIGDNPGGQEVVSPLDKLTGIVTSAVMSAMKFSQPQGGGDVILNVDGRTLARVVQPFLNAESKRIGNNVKLRTT